TAISASRRATASRPRAPRWTSIILGCCASPKNSPRQCGRAAPTANRARWPGSMCCRCSRCRISRRTAPTRPRRPPLCRWRNACAPSSRRPACASSTCFPDRSTMNGIRRCRRRRSRRCAAAPRTFIRATWRRIGSSAGATIQRRWSASLRRCHSRNGAFGIWIEDAMSDTVLSRLLAELAGGRIRIVDLTQTLSPDFPQIVLPPEMGQAWPFRIEEASRYDARGPGWYWNNFSCSEHTGTHFDAPIHWISGRHLPDNATDTIAADKFVAPACVLDCSRQAAADADFLLTVGFLRQWERRHGRIASGSWVLMRTDWSKRSDPVAYQNIDETGQHTPGPDTDAVRFLVEERGVLGFGSEAIGTDAGQAFHLKPPYPCHYYMHGSGRFGLQCLTNLDLLPPTGSLIIAAPLKIKEGSGSPLRVLALVPQAPPATAAPRVAHKATKKSRARKRRK